MTQTVIEKNLKKIKQNVKLKPKDIQIPLLCAISLFAKLNGIPLGFMPLIYLQLAQEQGQKIACLIISVGAMALMTVKTAWYVPYIAFTAIYIATDKLLKNSYIKPRWVATFVFAAVRFYTLTFGYDFSYWVTFIAEVLALLFLPAILPEGIESLKLTRSSQEAIDLFSAACTLIFVALTLCGINIWSVNLGCAFLLGLSVYYAHKQSAPLSVLSMLSMLFILSQSQHFTYLFIGFMAIYLVGIFIPLNIWQGYLAQGAFALALSLLFVTKFNSFIFITTTIAALILYFLVDKFTILNPSVVVANKNDTTEKDYNLLMSKLEKLNRSFKFMGNTVVDISNLLNKEDIPKQLEDMVANEVCKSCKNNTYCWQEKFGDTQQQFTKCASMVQRGQEANFDEWFISSCSRISKLYSAFTSSAQLLCTKQLIAASGRQSQKMLQSQFLAMSQILQEITYESKKNGIVNTAFTHNINNLLITMGKRVNYCLCCQNNNKLIINTSEQLSEKETDKIKRKLEMMYSSKFAMPAISQNQQEYTYVFNEIPMFGFDYHFSHKSCKQVCGDSCEIVQTDNIVYLLLTDGMGTGSFAAAESKTAVSMLKSLLCASVSPATAIDTVNIALNLKGNGQSCVSVDILTLDLYTGKCSIIKAGGAASLVLKANDINIVAKDSLPIGILKDTNTASTEFLLNSGDIVLVMSDGIEITNRFVQKLKLIGNGYSSTDISSYIIENCAGNDDSTVAAIKLVRV